MIKQSKTSVLFIILILFFICNTQAKRIAFTSILPHKYIAQNIAGDRFTIHVLVGDGQNAHNYTPNPVQMVALSQAELFFRAGVEFEDGVLPKIKKNGSNIFFVDLRKDISLRITSGAHDECCDEKNHDNESDPHIWLSPRLMKTQAITIKNSFVEIDPEGKLYYEKNLLSIINKLDTLDRYLHTILDSYAQSILFVFHPAFGYFADEYGLVQKAVETGGKEPSAKAIVHLIDEARKYKPKVIFVQPQYSQKSAQTIAKQIGCVVVPINPLPADYLREMQLMGETIKAGLVK